MLYFSPPSEEVYLSLIIINVRDSHAYQVKHEHSMFLSSTLISCLLLFYCIWNYLS